MSRFIALLLLLLLAAPAFAQEEKPAKEAEADPGIPADFNEYLRKSYPGLDPGGEHDLFALKDPTDEAKRHDYTVAMAQLLLAYLGSLEMSSTVAKVFDQYSRGKEANQATFKVLHAIVLMRYPPGKPNTNEAQKLLLQAAEQAPKYAYPWFLQALFFEYPRFDQIPNTSPREVLASLDKALAIRPDFLRATLLKCDVFLRANPPRLAEINEMIEPHFKKLPPMHEDFEDLLNLYRKTHSLDELNAKVEELHQKFKLTEKQKLLCKRFQAIQQQVLKQFDAAIVTLEQMLTLIDTKQAPGDAIWVNRGLAACWGTKAMRIKDTDPEFRESGSRASYDSFIAEASRLQELCADIERAHLPLSLRGIEARQYAEFLLYTGRAERAYEWLGTYLDNTDLSSAQRTVLRNLHAQIGIIVNPTEEGLLNLYESYVAADDMDRLAISMGLAEHNLRVEQQHFKTERALKFFISQLDNRIRLTVGFVAVLAADTALQIGGDVIATTGEAIVVRLEKETELNSDEQAKLQATLCEALKRLGHRPSQERAIRHCAKLIEESKAHTLRSLITDIMKEWTDEAYRIGLKTPPPKPGAMDKLNPTRAAAWLKKLADAVKAE